MKTLLCLLTATLLLTGCNRAPDPRIVDLEKRIKELEARHESSFDILTNLSGIVGQMSSITTTYARDMRKAQSDLAAATTNALDVIFDRLDANTAAIQSITNRQPIRYMPASVAPISGTPNRSGLPVAVHAQIVADAQRKYPTDFDMQEFVIKQQTEAYRRLHP